MTKDDLLWMTGIPSHNRAAFFLVLKEGWQTPGLAHWAESSDSRWRLEPTNEDTFDDIYEDEIGPNFRFLEIPLWK